LKRSETVLGLVRTTELLLGVLSCRTACANAAGAAVSAARATAITSTLLFKTLLRSRAYGL
jgi:hypothetical protein